MRHARDVDWDGQQFTVELCLRKTDPSERKIMAIKNIEETESAWTMRTSRGKVAA